MTADLAVRDASAPLALRPGQMIFDDLQQKALAAMGVKNATKADLAVFAHVCHRTRLDPFTRQIYMIERREMVAGKWVSKQTIQTGIDGFRVIRDRAAERTDCEAELEDTIWYDADGKAYTEWLWDTPPTSCRVVLVKHSNKTGRALRFPAVLRTAGYMAMKDGKPTGQWRTEKQPDHMIEKCCEAFACRRAFPHDFAGIYLEEEMLATAADGRDDPAIRKVAAADILGQPAPDDEVAEGEIVDDQDTSDEVAKQEPQPAPVTAQEVNDHFKALGFTAADQAEVLHAARVLAGRKPPLTAISALAPEQLAAVAAKLEGCDDRGGLVALLAEAGQPADRPTGAASATGTEEATRGRQHRAPAATAPSSRLSPPAGSDDDSGSEASDG